MSEITLEKIDIVRERTGANYSEAKEALEACEGNVVDALI
jgi:NACalpha-BTF3-like transcription factor